MGKPPNLAQYQIVNRKKTNKQTNEHAHIQKAFYCLLYDNGDGKKIDRRARCIVKIQAISFCQFGVFIAFGGFSLISFSMGMCSLSQNDCYRVLALRNAHTEVYLENHWNLTME